MILLMATYLIVCLLITITHKLKSAQQSKPNRLWQWLGKHSQPSNKELNIDDLDYTPLSEWETSFAGARRAKVMKGKRIFGALGDEGGHISIKAWMHSEVEYVIPEVMTDNFLLPGCSNDLVRISLFSIDSDWKNTIIGYKILPLALQDIRLNWPNAIRVYFKSDDIDVDNIKLFVSNNFTLITKSGNRGTKLYVYNFPLSAEDIEYRTWQIGDLDEYRPRTSTVILYAIIRRGEESMIADWKDPKGAISYNVAQYVPDPVLKELDNKKDNDHEFVHISHFVMGYTWRHVEKFGSTYLRQALHDIRKRWPNAISAFYKPPSYPHYTDEILKECGFKTIAGNDGKVRIVAFVYLMRVLLSVVD